MKKKWGYTGLAVLLGLGLTGCEAPPTDGSRLPRYSYEEQQGDLWDDWEGWDNFNSPDIPDDWDDWDDYDGWEDDYKDFYNSGGLGDVMENVFFDFQVEEAALADSYAGYEPDEDYMLVDVIIALENTFWEALPMYNSDFMLQWGEESGEYSYGLSELSQVSSEVMPEAFYLEVGEQARFHLIYEVPKGAKQYSLIYLEEYDDGSVGDIYFVDFVPESREL